MKRIIFILSIIVFIALIILLVFFNKKNDMKYVSLFENDNYKKINLDSITSIEQIHYTEAGDNRVILDDKVQINRVYNYLKKLKIGEETDMACEDNTTIYLINLNDGVQASVEIECDWVVIGDKRYLLKRKSDD